ncbi:MAG: M16 family metallopeptidase [Roseovarius sp.]
MTMAFAVAFVRPALANGQVSTFELENGMQIVVVEDHRAPVVVHMVWYRAGSADEQPGVSGVAHFLEHLLFKGTETLEPGEFSSTVQRNGGSDNAFTSYDYTAYFQRIAADRLELMMRMESDRMVNIQLGVDDIATERDVIIEERNQRTENDPFALFREQKNAAQFLNHRYGVPVIGWRHEMVDLSLEDALAYYEQFYAPNNAILVVAGDVEPDAVHELAKTYYGVIPPNPDLKPRDRPQEPPQTAARRLVFEDPRVSQTYVSRTYTAPERDPGNQEEAAALTMLAYVLGDGPNSVLTEKLQFESKKTVWNGAWYGDLSLDDTTFTVIAAPAQGVSLQEAEDAIDAALAEFMQEGVDPLDLERIRTQIRAARIYELDDVGSIADEYGRALTSGLTIEDVQAWPDILQAVTEEDIMNAAKNVFDRKQSVTGWLRAPEVTQ